MRLGDAVTTALPALRAEAESRMTDEVEIHRHAPGAEDRYGNPTATWAPAVTVKAWTSNPSGRPSDGERIGTSETEVVHRRRCNVPAGTAVDASDRIVDVYGVTWLVDGPPIPHGPASDPIYLELQLVWVENT